MNILNLAPFKYLEGLQWGIWGGAARALFLDSEPRDIDIAVDCSEEELVRRFSAAGRNRFGGIKLTDTNSGLVFDIWPLNKTWNFLIGGIEPTFENLASVGPFNIDCIVAKSEKLGISFIDKGFWDGMVKGLLEVNFEPNPHPQHNILRGIRLMEKLNLAAGPSFIRYAAKYKDSLRNELARHEGYYNVKINPTLFGSVLSE